MEASSPKYATAPRCITWTNPSTAGLPNQASPMPSETAGMHARGNTKDTRSERWSNGSPRIACHSAFGESVSRTARRNPRPTRQPSRTAK